MEGIRKAYIVTIGSNAVERSFLYFFLIVFVAVFVFYCLWFLLKLTFVEFGMV